MKRKIVCYHQVPNSSEWIVELDCFHRLHTAHQQDLNSEIDCKLCNELNFPEGLAAYKRTPEFTEQNIPKGLLNHHATKAGTWGKIWVLEGALTFTLNGYESVELKAGDTRHIPPQMLHAVKANKSVRFYVEFYTQDQSKKL